MYYKCHITKKIGKRCIFGIHLHHYIKQQHYRKNKKWFEDNGIKQKTFWLYFTVHQDLHNMNDEKFYRKYKIDKNDYLFNKRKYLTKE